MSDASRTGPASSRDVVVIGAGPAGAIVARELARLGRDVLLVEREDWPRNKVCGGCLGAATLELLARNDLRCLTDRSGAVPFRRLRLAGWGRSVELELPGGAALSRRALDDGLVGAARAAGVEFLAGTTARIGPVDASGEHRIVTLRPRDGAGDGDREVAARVVVSAAGLHGAGAVDGLRPEVATEEGPDAHPEVVATGAGGGRVAAIFRLLLRQRRPACPGSPPAGRVGLGTTLVAPPRSYREGTIEMAIGAAGYVGGVQIEDGRWNLAAAVDPDPLRERGPGAVVSRILDTAGLEAPDGLDDASWKGTPTLTRSGRLAAPRFLAVGDAAGYVEPFTGEGILWALQAGLAAAPLADRGVREWSDAIESTWRLTWLREIRMDQRWCMGLAWVLGESTRARLATSVVCLLPGLAGPLTEQLTVRDRRGPGT